MCRYNGGGHIFDTRPVIFADSLIHQLLHMSASLLTLNYFINVYRIS